MTNPDAGRDPRSFYIAPQKSRLLTGSWHAIQAALTTGLLERLAGRLLRGLGVVNRYLPYNPMY